MSVTSFLYVACVCLPELEYARWAEKTEMFVSGITGTGHLRESQWGQEGRMLCESLAFDKVQLRCVSV